MKQSISMSARSAAKRSISATWRRSSITRNRYTSRSDRTHRALVFPETLIARFVGMAALGLQRVKALLNLRCRLQAFARLANLPGRLECTHFLEQLIALLRTLDVQPEYFLYVGRSFILRGHGARIAKSALSCGRTRRNNGLQWTVQTWLLV